MSAPVAMDEDPGLEEGETQAPPAPRLRSTITARKQKGRGHADKMEVDGGDRYGGQGFESLEPESGPGPQRSVEGWIVMATGVHEEAQEDDIHEAFGHYGDVRNIHLNLDRRTGFVKGYALVEYETKQNAQDAIHGLNKTELLGLPIAVDWAFSKGPLRAGGARRR
eukprot:jgi/Mesvir1/29218/Mv20412-RA.1